MGVAAGRNPGVRWIRRTSFHRRRPPEPALARSRTASVEAVPLTPEEFYQHALASADADRRLPLSRMTGWEISPFEQDQLLVAPLQPPVLPEAPRYGEDPERCQWCRARDDGLWL